MLSQGKITPSLSSSLSSPSIHLIESSAFLIAENVSVAENVEFIPCSFAANIAVVDFPEPLPPQLNKIGKTLAHLLGTNRYVATIGNIKSRWGNITACPRISDMFAYKLRLSSHSSVQLSISAR
ncbi:hypothetical protein [Nostoc sp. TCL26-01]|uniref:hypothetical protein n=1 Tax=Nostoc sp. TCL26-01 TaxID=2576904 RepID=UPI0015BF6C41|nr:hypothetical protein [Nostoc sp. TCL26-01]QLE54825.1 hypothetical protein FD725_04425 [Nostoc sp. TCL26-01]